MKIHDSEVFIKKNIDEAQKIINQYVAFFDANQDFIKHLQDKYNIKQKFLLDIKKNANNPTSTNR